VSARVDVNETGIGSYSSAESAGVPQFRCRRGCLFRSAGKNEIKCTVFHVVRAACGSRANSIVFRASVGRVDANQFSSKVVPNLISYFQSRGEPLPHVFRGKVIRDAFLDISMGSDNLFSGDVAKFERVEKGGVFVAVGENSPCWP